MARTKKTLGEAVSKEIQSNFNLDAFKKWTKSNGLVKTSCKSGEYYRIPEKMWLIGDSIASDFFIT